MDKDLINQLNFEIVNSLKKSKSSFKTLKFFIKDKQIQYLIRKYKLNNKYKESNKFLDDFNIVKMTFIDSNNFWFIKKLEIKINKIKSVNFKNENMVNSNLKSNKSINIRFIVDGKTNFSKMDLDFLDNCTKN